MEIGREVAIHTPSPKTWPHDTVPYREALVSWLLRERLGQADQNDLIWMPRLVIPELSACWASPGSGLVLLCVGTKDHDNLGLRLSLRILGRPSTGLGTADWSVSNTMRTPSRVCRPSACSSVSGRAARVRQAGLLPPFPVSTALKGRHAGFEK